MTGAACFAPHGKRVSTAHQTFYRVTRADPCEVCGKPDWCRRFDDGYLECMRAESDRPTRNGGWLHWIGDGPAPGGDWRDRLAVLPPLDDADPDPIDDDLCDAVYRFVLDQCPLNDGHLSHLHRTRGLTQEQIARHGYGSLTDARRDTVAAAAVDRFGPGILGAVPGFYWRRPGVPSIRSTAGMLIAVKDVTRRVIRLRVRPDDDATRADGKYRWVSCPDRDGGVGSGAPVHIARPSGASSQAVRFGITEGELKGNAASDWLRMTFVCIPGVTITDGVIPTLRQLGATEVATFFDRDTATNPLVARAEAELIDGLTEAGFVVYRATWPTEHKGIDDALVAGVLPMLEPTRTTDDCTEALAAKDYEIADLKRQLKELRELHSAVVAAHHAPHLGPERATAAALVVDLSTSPVGEWRPMPHKRIAEQAGMSDRAVPRHLKLLKPIIDDVVEIKTEWVPETVNMETGEIKRGHRQTFARLKTDRVKALRVIATATPTNGHKNGHGGHRVVCPDCGDVGVIRKWADHCAGCGKLLEQGATRVRPGNRQDVRNGMAGDASSCEAAPNSGEESRPRQDVRNTVLPSTGNVLGSTILATHHNDEPLGPWYDDDGTTAAAAWQRGQPLPGFDRPPPQDTTVDRWTDVSIGRTHP